MPKTKKTAIGEDRLKEFAKRMTKLIEIETLRGLARKSGVNHTTLTSYEKGQSPNLNKLYKIADGANISFEWLATGKGPMYAKCIGTPDKLLAPENLEGTITDLRTVYKAIEHFERDIRKKGKSYTPDQVASSIMLLCIIAYGDVSKQDPSDIIKMMKSL